MISVYNDPAKTHVNLSKLIDAHRKSKEAVECGNIGGSTMQITINVDELQFKELVDGELKNLAPEKIQELIYEGVRNYLFSNPDVFKNLFVDSYRWHTEPSSYLKDLIKKNLKEDEFKDIQDEIIHTLRTNYDKILRDAITSVMFRGMFGSSEFESSVRETLRSIEMERANNG